MTKEVKNTIIIGLDNIKSEGNLVKSIEWDVIGFIPYVEPSNDFRAMEDMIYIGLSCEGLEEQINEAISNDKIVVVINYIEDIENDTSYTDEYLVQILDFGNGMFMDTVSHDIRVYTDVAL